MIYLILAIGLISVFISLFTRSKAPKLCVAFQIVTAASIVAAGIYYYVTTPQYTAFVEALANQFG